MGVPMGSPISDLLAEFKLRPLESRILNDLNVKPSFWVRYVDIFYYLGPSLPFLDVLLIKDNTNLSRSVYTKRI